MMKCKAASQTWKQNFESWTETKLNKNTKRPKKFDTITLVSKLTFDSWGDTSDSDSAAVHLNVIEIITKWSETHSYQACFKWWWWGQHQQQTDPTFSRHRQTLQKFLTVNLWEMLPNVWLSRVLQCSTWWIPKPSTGAPQTLARPRLAKKCVQWPDWNIRPLTMYSLAFNHTIHIWFRG